MILPAGGVRDTVGNPSAAGFRSTFTTRGPSGTNGGGEFLLGRWPLDNDALDVSGNDLDASLAGGATFTEDRAEGSSALSLDGQDDHLLVAGLQLDDVFTLSLWVVVST